MKFLSKKLNNSLIKEISVISLLFFLTIIYFNNLVFNKKLFLTGDISRFFYPGRVYAKNCISKGLFPLWNTDIFLGVPYIADIQNAFFYPFNMFFYLFSFNFALTSILVIHIFMAGWFLYLLMRISFSLDRTSSLISAIIYMFSGFFTMHMGHLNQIMACAWTPLIMLVYIRSIEKKKNIYIALLGILFGLQLFTGGIQNLFYLIITLFSLSIYISFGRYISLKDTKECALPILYLFAGILTGFAVSAAQVLPTYELTGLSSRANGLSYIEASADSLSPLQFVINFLLPNYFGYYGNHPYWGTSFPSEMASYIGILPIALSIYALFKSKEKKFVYFFWIFSIIALVFAMGKYTPIYKLFFNFGFNRFRSPARFIYIFNLSIAIIAGFGINTLFSPNNHSQKMQETPSSLGRVLIISFLIAVFIALYSLINHPLERFSKMSLSIADYRTMWYKDAIITIISIISLLFIFERSLSKTIKKVIIFSVILFSLFNFTSESEFQNASLSYGIDPEKNRGEIIEYLKNDHSLYRIFRLATNKLIPNSGLLFNIEDIGGYGSGILPLSPYHEFIKKVRYLKNGDLIINFTLLEMLNVKYIISDLNITFPAYKEILTEGSTHLYLNTNFIPRAFLVETADVAKNSREILDRISDRRFYFQKKMFLEKKPRYQGMENKTTIKNNFTNILTYTPNLIEIEAGLIKKGFLFLSDSYYPGWKVFIDEKPGKILRANYNFRGVALNKGVHKIRFVYKPALYYIGLSISGTTLILFLLFILVRPVSFHKLPFDSAEPSG